MKLWKNLSWILLILSPVIPCLAQALSPTKVEFEAASVKPSKPGEGKSLQGGPGLLTTTAVPLKELVAEAYRVRDFQISGGLGWVASDGWSIVAKFTPAPPRRNGKEPSTFELMLQSLLEDRFRLQVHRDNREMPVYALTVAKGGPKIKLSADQSPIPPPDPGTPPSPPQRGQPLHRGASLMGRGTLEATAVPIATLIQTIFQQLDRIVIDKTGLTGLYDVKLQWNPQVRLSEPDSTANESDGPSIFTAVQEQLGLKLESTKGPVEVLVIDHAEKPTEN